MKSSRLWFSGSIFCISSGWNWISIKALFLKHLRVKWIFSPFHLLVLTSEGRAWLVGCKGNPYSILYFLIVNHFFNIICHIKRHQILSIVKYLVRIFFKIRPQLHPAVGCTWIDGVYWHLMVGCNRSTVPQLHHRFPPFFTEIFRSSSKLLGIWNLIWDIFPDI